LFVFGFANNKFENKKRERGRERERERKNKEREGLRRRCIVQRA